MGLDSGKQLTRTQRAIDNTVRHAEPKAKRLCLSVKVYDMLENKVLSSPACSAGTPSEGGHIRLDVSGLAADVHFVREDGKIYMFVES